MLEVGGEAATYCSVADVAGWDATVGRLLDERASEPEQWRQRQAAGAAQARRFSWREHARQTSELYQTVLSHRSADHESSAFRTLHVAAR